MLIRVVATNVFSLFTLFISLSFYFFIVFYADHRAEPLRRRCRR